MKIKNYRKILSILKENDKVLDIGGWERPFNRATHVLDILPFHSRKKINSFPKEMKEHFNKNTWIMHDIKNKLPFNDKEFDFVICGHVLEDIKDPAFLAEEIKRISKSGYFEFPNRAYEMKNNVDPFLNSDRYVGFCHHRWMVEARNGVLIFTPKTLIHSAYKELRCVKVKEKYTGFFWKNSFKLKEIFFSSQKEIIDDALKFRSIADNIPMHLMKKINKVNRAISIIRYCFNFPILINRFINKKIKD